ncbi:MAG: HD domain-containing protein [Anaerolineae bacterium]|uniref:HD domain-containing protein n=1 Tax=Promineifilum sp. TaxID=2664178 RepID=UPI001D55C94B|nr:HD domain-containing protein [Anaerolineales bacterium]MCB8934665.1 HD domain-containing protein [Promineifilum sp.]MCO5180977.1 HD domain-containing protein [Promineifilum sp.]MCW5846661.1 HD domain-containing protein [Anaerolineae bacterium]
MVTLDDVRQDEEVATLLDYANQYLRALGYTEHSTRHATLVAETARTILIQGNHSQRMGELAAIAGYLHDIGNVIHRQNHAQSSSVIALNLLSRLGMAWDECAVIVNAIGNHEEERGYATTPVAAAIIIADKADVHRSRVQAESFEDFDIHDRVNYATTERQVVVDAPGKVISLELTIDTGFAQVIEYFEIFLDRMVMVKQAAEFLGYHFRLVINGTTFS